MNIAAQLITDDTFNICMLVALILFIIGGVMAIIEKGWVLGLACAGLAFMALAWFAVS